MPDPPDTPADRGRTADRVRAAVAVVLLVVMVAYLRSAWTDASFAGSLAWTALVGGAVATLAAVTGRRSGRR